MRISFCLGVISLLIFGKVIIDIRMKEEKVDNVMRFKELNSIFFIYLLVI